MQKKRAGIVGAGGISDYHAVGYRAADVVVEAIADPDRKRAEERAQKHAIPKIFSSYEEMLKACSEIDLISVCTPNRFHAEITIAALAAGKDVFCEKPPALNAAEALRMKEAAEKYQRLLVFDFNNRARPEAQAMMQYIATGEIGRINSCQAFWIRRCGIPGFGGWFTQKDLSGGGPVIDLLHMLDLGLYLMGFPKPEWVLAQTFRDFADNPDFKGPWGLPDVSGGVVDVEMASHAFIRFAGGQVLFARSSWAEMNQREEVSVTFQGTKAGGTIRRLFGRDGIDATAFDTCQLYTMENGRPVNREIIVTPDEHMGRVAAVVNFVAAAAGKEPPLSTPQEAVILMQIIDSLYRSAETAAPVKV